MQIQAIASICDCLNKTHIVCTKTEFSFIATVYRYNQYLAICNKCQMLTIVWFSGGHFADPPKPQVEQWHHAMEGAD